MKPSLYIPNPAPVQALQFTGQNWQDVRLFIGACLLYSTDLDNGGMTLFFEDWTCDLNPNDWVVKYISNDVIVVDDDGFKRSYNPVESDLEK